MNRKIIKNKTEHFLRLLYVNSITIKNKSVLLVEYPKSGGTWLGQLVSNYLKIPFPRNKFPLTQRSFFHSHYLPKYRIPKNKKIIFLVRDGRDVLISLYYHHLVWNDKNKLSPKDVIYHRSNLPFDDYDDIKANLAEFITYTFNHKPSRLKHFTFMGNWFDYNQSWLNEMNTNDNIYMIRYEDLLDDTEASILKLLKEFFKIYDIDREHLKNVINEFSFENQSRRKKGEENKNSFLRKGIKGDWKNYFGVKERELFKQYTNDLLVRLNYEKDNNW